MLFYWAQMGLKTFVVHSCTVYHFNKSVLCVLPLALRRVGKEFQIGIMNLHGGNIQQVDLLVSIAVMM